MQHVRLEHLAKQDLAEIMPIAFLTLAARESLIVVCHNLHGNTLCAQKGNVCELVCANDIYIETMLYGMDELCTNLLMATNKLITTLRYSLILIRVC